MKQQKILYLLPLLIFGTILLATELSKGHFEDLPKKRNNTTISNDEDFDKMMLVLMHQRCMNCHPSDDKPKQGEDSHPHYFGLERGQEDLGFDAINCSTCHQDENNDFSGVPGAPAWSLAPASMRWEGLSRTEIAASIIDKARNGGRTHEDVMHHLTEHPLVLWAWNPGIDAAGNPREKPPVPVDEYIIAVKNWFEAGAQIPVK